MESDLRDLIKITGDYGTPSTTSFREALHNGQTIRFLTISKEDLGICYATYKGYLILTTSFDQIKEALNIIDLKDHSSVPRDKIGQLFIVGIEGTEMTQEIQEFIQEYKPGGILLLKKNIVDADQLKKLTNDLQRISREVIGQDLFIAIDQEGGEISRVSFVSEQTPQSEIMDIDRAYQVGKDRGSELANLGINLNLAPLLDSSDSSDFIYNRSFQRSIDDIGNLSKSMILGQ